MFTRREFLFSAVAALAFQTLGCKERIAVLRIPVDAADCLDLYTFFTDPKLTSDRVRSAFGLTGEPKVLKSSDTWTRNTFENQNGHAKSVELNTSVDETYGEYFSGIYIDYTKPIGVSLSAMKGKLGVPTERTKKVPVFGTHSTASFTNLMPGQKEKEEVSYGFYPEASDPGKMKVSVLFTADSTYWDTKTVNFLRFERRPV
jgi:hypothetical protein